MHIFKQDNKTRVRSQDTTKQDNNYYICYIKIEQ